MNRETSTLELIAQSELVEAIRNATDEVFSTMLNLELRPGDVFVEKEQVGPASGVVSLIGLAGPWVGSGSLSCTAAFACKIASHLLDMKYEAMNEDVLDAVAEVTNMIIGNVKTALEDRLGAMGLSIPTVIYGRNFQTRSVGSPEWTVVPFLLDDERMCVQICISPNPDAAKKSPRAGFPIPHVLQS
jgi:chemotaxis protein CheX